MPTPPRRRWYQFGIASLLLAVTAVALVSWAYWIAWPSWREHRERLRFEESVRTFRTPMSQDEVWQESWRKPDYTMFWGGRSEKESITMSRYPWRRAVYFIYFVNEFPPNRSPCSYSSASVPSKSLEVFRVQPPRSDYAPQTERGRKAGRDDGAVRLHGGLGFMGDFLDFISGDRANNPGFEYELIYADLPNSSPQSE